MRYFVLVNIIHGLILLVGSELWCLTATFNNISVISWRSVYWWSKSDSPEKTTDLWQVTNKLDHYFTSNFIPSGTISYQDKLDCCVYQTILTLFDKTLSELSVFTVINTCVIRLYLRRGVLLFSN
jgi:hypothetical protein